MPPSSYVQSDRGENAMGNSSRGSYDGGADKNAGSMTATPQLNKPDPSPLYNGRQMPPCKSTAKTSMRQNGTKSHLGADQQKKHNVRDAQSVSGHPNSSGNQNLGIEARPRASMNYDRTVGSSNDELLTSQESVVSSGSGKRPLKPPASLSACSLPVRNTPQPLISTRIASLSGESSFPAAPVTPSPSYSAAGSSGRYEQVRLPTPQESQEVQRKREALPSPSWYTAHPSSRSVGSTSEGSTAPSRSNAVSPTSTPTASNTRESNSKSEAFGKVSADAIEWRKHGKRYRAHLVLEDEEKGGNAFELSNDCSIERYYKVAERVLEQFLSTSIRKNANESELAESYLVGNRLVKFLSIVLPSHYEYFSNNPELQTLRKQSQGQLVELLQYLEEVAMAIDELQYNKYILRDLTPEEEGMVLGLTGIEGQPTADTSASATEGSQSGSPSSQTVATKEQHALPLQRQQSRGQSRVYGRRKEHDYSQHSGSPSIDASLASNSVANDSSRSGGDALHHMVARVVRVTESFSDTYETNQEQKQKASSTFLQQTLRAAAATAAKRSEPTQGTRSPSPGRPPMQPPPSVKRTNRVSSTQQTTMSTDSSLHPDPDIRTLPSFESSEGSKGDPDNTLPSTWHSDTFSDFDFGGLEDLSVGDDDAPCPDTPASQSRIDLLEQATDIGSSSKNAVNVDRVKAQWRALYTAPREVPKLKRPPEAPPRAARAKAASAMEPRKGPAHGNGQGDRSAEKEKNNRNEEEKKSDETFLPNTVEELLWDKPAFKTKIEERLERASVVQDELDSIERQEFEYYASMQPWRQRSERNPTNPFEDDDNSIFPAEDPKAAQVSNRTLLRHFRGCVNCLLD